MKQYKNFRFQAKAIIFAFALLMAPQVLRAQGSSGATINMSDAAPPASGTGWTYASNVYTISNR